MDMLKSHGSWPFQSDIGALHRGSGILVSMRLLTAASTLAIRALRVGGVTLPLRVFFHSSV